MNWFPEYPRLLPARRPEGHQPRAPRWSAVYARPVSAITCDYVALQVEGTPRDVIDEFMSLIELSVDHRYGPASSEVLTFTSGARTDIIFLGYWTDATRHARWSRQSPLGAWFRGLDASGVGFGAWRETIQVPPDRVETVYSSPSRRFGFAACEGIDLTLITTNGYFGAARDRMPVSAIDALEAPIAYQARDVRSRGRRVRATLAVNAVAIRSGQYWQSAEGDQLDDYEQELEPKMLRGMTYLENNPEQTGTLSLRVVRSGFDENPVRRETSVLAYFRSLDDLERWSSQHATHAAIHAHAIEKNRLYGDARSVTTWHEVFALPESTVFEYVNCHPSTGILGFAEQIWELSGV